MALAPNSTGTIAVGIADGTTATMTIGAL